MKKRYRVILALVFVVLAVGFVLLAGFNVKPDPSPTVSNTPSPTVSLAPEQQKEQTAGNTATLFMEVVVEGVKEQLGEETANSIQVGSSVSQTDNQNKPAKVALLYLSDVPKSLDINKNIDYVDNFMKTVNENEGLNWTVVKADPTEFEDNTVLGAMKIFEEGENPANPSIVEISFTQAPDSDTLEIFVSATVY